MTDYQTTEEKAAEWNITPHHVQYLCRKGKIEGAIKRAGVWFIPGNTPVPVKNTKSDVKGFRFVGTKERIFCAAIELFMLKGFSSVSLKNIADRVGIRQSTIYNHFASKQDILDTIYDFYCHYYLKDRRSLKDMEAELSTGSPMDIIECVRYEFKEEYRQKMADITRIVFQRIAIDDRAREIAKSLMVDEGIRYVEDIFNWAVESGNLAPFNTRAMAVFINSVRIFSLYYWIVDPSSESMARLADDERVLYRYAAEFINANAKQE